MEHVLLPSHQNQMNMISVLSTTNKYILQSSLIDMHKQSIDWQSAAELWKCEIKFFQKLLDSRSSSFQFEEDKKKISHFQSLITYYGGEVIDNLASKLRKHEASLAHILKNNDESDNSYFNEHKGLIDELTQFSMQFDKLKYELLCFMEPALN